MSHYFVKLSEQTAGPFTLEQMLKLVAGGKIAAGTPVSVDGREFVFAQTLPELGLAQGGGEKLAVAEHEIETSFCPSCCGEIAAYTVVCPLCNYNMAAVATHRRSQRNSEPDIDVIASFVDRTPGAKRISKSMGLDLKLKNLTIAGKGLVALTALISLAAVFTAMITLAPQDSSNSTIRVIAVAAAIFPGAIAFGVGRFLLSLAKIEIVKGKKVGR